MSITKCSKYSKSGNKQYFEYFCDIIFRTADQSELEVDGYSSTNSQQRISLGGISNPFREEKVRQCQKNIREGKMPNYICHFYDTYSLTKI